MFNKAETEHAKVSASYNEIQLFKLRKLDIELIYNEIRLDILS